MPFDALPPLGNGRYVIESVIGKGGMSTVYRAHDTWLDIYRAIKILSPELAEKQTIRRRFELEARTMARLRHPHIVTVHDVGFDEAVLYIVMEYIKGGTVRELLRMHGKLPARPVTSMIQGICDALQAAHDKGVVHRDIKPHNMLLTQSGVVKMTDFGIARLTDNNNRGDTKAGDLMGTWAYMSPEQRSSAKTVDPRADVYSMGASLYSLVTNKEPADLFAASADLEIRGETYKGIPEELADIIEKATKYRPSDRYATAEAFGHALTEVMPKLPKTDFKITKYTQRDAKSRRALLRKRRKERQIARGDSATAAGLQEGTSGGTMGDTMGTMGDTIGTMGLTASTSAGTSATEAKAEENFPQPGLIDSEKPRLVRQTRAPTPAPPPMREESSSHVTDGMADDVIVFGNYDDEGDLNEVPDEQHESKPQLGSVDALRAAVRTRSAARLARSIEQEGPQTVVERPQAPFRPPPTDVSVGKALNRRTHPLGMVAVFAGMGAMFAVVTSVHKAQGINANFQPNLFSETIVMPTISKPEKMPDPLAIPLEAFDALADDPFNPISEEEVEVKATPRRRSTAKVNTDVVEAPELEAEPEPPKPPGKLFINSVPWSKIAIDGSSIGRTPWSGSLPSGAHKLQLTTADGQTTRVPVNVIQDGTVRFCWDWASKNKCGSK